MQGTICDRCGKNFNYLQIRNALIDELNEYGAVYNMTEENTHDYEEKRVDLCPTCVKSLGEWMRGKDNDRQG